MPDLTPDFTDASQNNMSRVVDALIDWTETEGVKNGITLEHVLALFCLQ
jgi:hypothetical protein